MPHNIIILYFLYLNFMSQKVLYFLHSTSLHSFHIDAVLTVSILILYQQNDRRGRYISDIFDCRFLTHWGQVTHICVDKLTIIGSDNSLSPGRRQAIIWTNVGILLIEPSGTNFSEILIAIITFSVKKMHLKMSSGNWRPFCLGLNELNELFSTLISVARISFFLWCSC